MSNGRTRVKLCGMTNSADITQACLLGADAIGLILYPNSRRYVSIKQAQVLLSSLPPFVDVVAVLVNPTRAKVEEIIETLPIHYLQFHGNESPEFCNQFNFPFIKAIAAISTDVILTAIEQYDAAAAILVDTPSLVGESGGTGQIFDWKIIPPILQKHIILAGGLTDTNVAQAIKQVNPYAVDVCSGIEQHAGIKDQKKMIQFLNAVGQ